MVNSQFSIVIRGESRIVASIRMTNENWELSIDQIVPAPLTKVFRKECVS
jgi:hypothetical protein